MARFFKKSIRQTAGTSRLAAEPYRVEYLLLLLGAVFCLLVFAGSDIAETARHGYLLIRSTLDGDFFDFFENVYNRVYPYSYTDAAHGNILLYLLYAVWELPLYLIERVGGFAFTDLALGLWCKWLGAGCYLGCGLLTGALARRLDCPQTICCWAPLFFWLNPISFFTTLVAGQYESICLFFLLWALLFYLDGRMIQFSLAMGAGMIFHPLSIFLLIPLVLLAEKKLSRAACYLLLSLWLWLPTNLLFWGRTAKDVRYFRQQAFQQLFVKTFPGGVADVSLFLLIFVLVCIGVRLWTPANRAQLNRTAVFLGLAVFGLFFLFVFWQPEWLILLVPFSLLTSLQARDKALFALMQGIFCAGYFLLLFFLFSGQLEANLIDGGLVFLFSGFQFSDLQNARTVSFYLSRISCLSDLAPLFFYGPLLAELFFKLPVGGAALADRLCGEERPFSCRTACWGIFVVGFGIFWAAPVLFCWLRAVGVF